MVSLPIAQNFQRQTALHRKAMRWAFHYAVIALALGPVGLQGVEVTTGSMGEAWQFAGLLAFIFSSVANRLAFASQASPFLIRSPSFLRLPSLCLTPRLFSIPEVLARDALGRFGG